MRHFIAAAAAALATGAFAQALDAPVALKTATGTLHGSLRMPAGIAKPPVLLIIAGSGPTDRDGNQPRLINDSLKHLAADLAAEGVATVRYDKRGIAYSREAGPAEKDLRFEHYVDDAAAWIDWLRADGRFPVVGVIGHSEGSLIGALALGKSKGDAFVSIAGVSRKAAEVIRGQLKPQLPAPLWNESERILAQLENGKTAEKPPKELLSLYRPEVQPYLISWFRYSPAEAFAKLDVPVLVVQGTADIQVMRSDAEALAASAKRSTLFLVEGMSHVLKRVTAERNSQMEGYTQVSVPIVTELAPRIAGFLRETRGAAPARGP
jgi:pimeloyl-ACP methyl ester carboxylesterase